MCDDGCMMYVCMYVCILDIVYARFKRETQAWPSLVGRLPSLILLEVCTDSVLLIN